MDSVRVDRWLSAARLYKSRTQATDACGAGHVLINGIPARASHAVRIGDEIRAVAPRGQVILEIRALADKRQSAAKARELYVDHSPPPPPRDERIAFRDRGSGRPTKAERRAIDKLRNR